MSALLLKYVYEEAAAIQQHAVFNNIIFAMLLMRLLLLAYKFAPRLDDLRACICPYAVALPTVKVDSAFI